MKIIYTQHIKCINISTVDGWVLGGDFCSYQNWPWNFQFQYITLLIGFQCCMTGLMGPWIKTLFTNQNFPGRIFISLCSIHLKNSFPNIFHNHIISYRTKTELWINILNTHWYSDTLYEYEYVDPYSIYVVHWVHEINIYIEFSSKIRLLWWNFFFFLFLPVKLSSRLNPITLHAFCILHYALYSKSSLLILL